MVHIESPLTAVITVFTVTSSISCVLYQNGGFPPWFHKTQISDARNSFITVPCDHKECKHNFALQGQVIGLVASYPGRSLIS